MEPTEILKIIAIGEDGRHQFKANFHNVDSLAAEMVAFSNSNGGQIFIGVSRDGQITGLSPEDIERLNQLVSNASSQSVRPPINPQTENIDLPEGLVMVVTILSGISKPYMDNNGAIWVKSGSDKRKVTSREEIQRVYQSAGLIHGDEVPANTMTPGDIDLEYFKRFFEKQYGEPLEGQELPLNTILTNMNLMKGEVLNVAGALLFAKTLEFRLPVFCVKCVVYPGNDIHVSEYRDSEDISGKLEVVFKRSLAFITRNLKRLQDAQDVNTLGVMEIPPIALEELLVNALVHRDYFISAPIRIFIFDNRIEIINPGNLPNNLTIENIKSGNSNIRNPILVSYASRILPYRGLGTGVRRALKEYYAIDFNNDTEGNLFHAIIQRPLECMAPHLNDFEHLAGSFNGLEVYYDLGYKFDRLESEEFSERPMLNGSMQRAYAEPYLVLYVSVLERKRGFDLGSLKYGLPRSYWEQITAHSKVDRERLMEVAKTQIIEDLKDLKEGRIPDSLKTVKYFEVKK